MIRIISFCGLLAGLDSHGNKDVKFLYLHNKVAYHLTLFFKYFTKSFPDCCISNRSTWFPPLPCHINVITLVHHYGYLLSQHLDLDDLFPRQPGIPTVSNQSCHAHLSTLICGLWDTSLFTPPCFKPTKTNIHRCGKDK